LAFGHLGKVVNVKMERHKLAMAETEKGQKLDGE
jgi:hypothetical protein